MNVGYSIVYNWVLARTGRTELHDLILLPLVVNDDELPDVGEADVLDGTTMGRQVSNLVLSFLSAEIGGIVGRYLSLMSITIFRYNKFMSTMVATSRRDKPTQLVMLDRTFGWDHPNHGNLTRMIVTRTRPEDPEADMTLTEALASLMQVASPNAVLSDIETSLYSDSPMRRELIAELERQIIELGWVDYVGFFDMLLEYETKVGGQNPAAAFDTLIKKIATGELPRPNASDLRDIAERYGKDESLLRQLLADAVTWGNSRLVLSVLQNFDNWSAELEQHPRAAIRLLIYALESPDPSIAGPVLANVTRNGVFSSESIQRALTVIANGGRRLHRLKIALNNASNYGLIDARVTRFTVPSGSSLTLSEWAGTIDDHDAASLALRWALKHGSPIPREDIVRTEWIERNKPLWRMILSGSRSGSASVSNAVDDRFQPR
jgi:hypothetical protein